MKHLLWIAALGVAMLGGCARQQGADVLAGTAGEGAAARHFTNTTPLRQRSLAPLSTPLYFEQNVGQADAQIRFLSRGPGYSVFLTRSGPVFGLASKPHAPVACKPASCAQAARQTDVVRMAFANANPDPLTEGVDPQPGKSHYFIGNDRKRWHPNVAHFAKVRYRKVYPGVDAVFYGNQSKLEYDFVVAPGADPRQIALDIDGVHSMRVDPAGDLVLSTHNGEMLQHRPVVYQQVANRRVAVEGRYVMRSDRQVGFELGTYDTHSPLVIDPMFGFSTYIGGTSDDSVNALATDADGNTYVAGTTHSMDLVPGQTHDPASGTAFVTKFDAIGNVQYTAYLGGTSGGETGDSVAVDATGRVYLAGRAYSEDFPVVNAAQDHLNGVSDAFVVRLAPDGGAIEYGTYFGGSGIEPMDYQDSLFDSNGSVHVAIDAGGSAYIVGGTASVDLPVVNALQPEHKVDPNWLPNPTGFLAKLSPDGGTVVYATYLGGTNGDTIYGIAVDASGNAYVAGRTSSTDFPTASPLQGSLGASSNFGDAFVAEVSADGSTLIYSTFLGGAYTDRATAIAVDAEGNAYVAGLTNSGDFPFSQFPSDCPLDAVNGFVAKVASMGQALSYSACLKAARPNALALDGAGHVYLTGEAGADLPTVDPMQALLNGAGYLPTDAFVTELAADGGSLLFSTYLGGNDQDIGNGIAVDGAGTIHVAGKTAATDFPTTNGSYATDAANTYFVSNGFVATIQGGIELTVADFKVAEGNDTHDVTFNVHLSSASTQPVTFDLDTVDLGPAPWAATEGVDYEGVHARGLVFAPGETDKAVTLTIYGDSTPETDAPDYAAYPGELFSVMPSNVVGATLRDLSAMATIGNDDTVISIEDMVEPEGTDINVSYDMPIRLSARVVVPVSFDYSVTDGSANAGSDYFVPSPQRITLDPGMIGAGVGITLGGDATAEPNETINVGLSNVEGATVGQSAATFTILNDDTTLSIADASVVEGNSGTKMANFTVSLAQPMAEPVTFDVATKNGTAVAGSDYTAASLAGVTIAPGSTSTTVSVPVVGDAVIEGNETFSVLISNVAGARVTDGTAVGTIRNDDTKLSIADVSVIEGNSGSKLATFTIKLSNASAQAVTFTAATANKTAAAGTDYVAKSLAGQSIAAGTTSKTFTVSILGDKTVEANETFLVNVSHVVGATVSDSQAVGTIRNDDTLLTIADASVTEGNTGTKTLSFTVKLSTASASPVTFNIATANKTALSGSDYVARSLAAQSIAAGATSKAFAVTLNGDRVREASETFLVNVTGVVGAAVNDGQAIGTIVNDD